MPKEISQVTKPNLFSFSSGLAEAHQEEVTEEIAFNKALDARSKEGIGKQIARLITAAVITAATGGNISAGKVGGEGAMYLYDLFSGSEKVGVGDAGKYKFLEHRERKSALKRYDRESVISDLVGTGITLATVDFGDIDDAFGLDNLWSDWNFGGGG